MNIDADLSPAMFVLIQRGRAALLDYQKSLPALEQGIGGAQMHIVTRADFLANAELVLESVETTGVPCRLLCASSGVICLLVERNPKARRY